MKRRYFLQKATAATALTAIGGFGIQSFSSLGAQKQITILHTNDVHSHIDAFNSSGNKNAKQGGVARRASLIDSIRKENPNTLLLDAGDIFQGTPYFNYYGGELEFKLMSMLKYDAATLGNHDFDNGIDGLYDQLPHAEFEFIIANYDFSNTIMHTHTKPYKIFFKNDIKIGVFGLGIKLDGLVNHELFKETKYLDPIETAQEMTRILKHEQDCDLIICLSHLGYYYKNTPDKICDLNLAKGTNNIDLIIGGHTHTFLPKPTIVKNVDDKHVLVNQVGCYGINLGRIDFYFDKENEKSAEGTSILI
ncbi:metallophosphoesterase [Tamlana fucoidanivorans]|uniref:Bifunctional metallophosphatase/5'-nucleotidase n=1 Tax=Allotamlana fucoidanivorans TaxID=2583814 RepID=A0A5C4SHH8_9FLAO|nr:metallophosphoesterase [Tamlana fucoidanivorans]TNJ43105.1 bifunctional metallophosphatase/5'-nucleotidase [Tamlana fucoidanivorans]